MAKNFSYKENTITSLNIKGTLSSDCDKITVEGKDKDFTVNLKEYLKEFADEYVEISVRTKMEKDLSE